MGHKESNQTISTKTYVVGTQKNHLNHAQIQKVLPAGSTFDNVFFFLMRGERIQIPIKADHHWPASETPFKWHFVGMPMMAQH